MTPGNEPARAAAIVHDWAEAGATWWIEAMWEAQSADGRLKAVQKRVEQGPPRFEKA